MKPNRITILLSIALLTQTGCMTAAKRTIKEFAGATSKLQVIPGTLSGSFAACDGASIGSPHSELGSLVPGKFTASLPTAMKTYLAEEDDAPLKGGSHVVNIQPQIQWFYKAKGLGSVIGNDSIAVVLFKLSSAGASATLQVVTKEGAARSDESSMAKSMAKELADWFEDQRDGDS